MMNHHKQIAALKTGRSRSGCSSCSQFMNSQMLHLSAVEVRRALPMRDAIAAMREAFSQLSRGEVTLPTRVRLDTPARHGAALIMPCHSAALKIFSLKMATVFHDNAKCGLPTIQSTVILTDGTPEHLSR